MFPGSMFPRFDVPCFHIISMVGYDYKVHYSQGSMFKEMSAFPTLDSGTLNPGNIDIAPINLLSIIWSQVNEQWAC